MADEEEFEFSFDDDEEEEEEATVTSKTSKKKKKKSSPKKPINDDRTSKDDQKATKMPLSEGVKRRLMQDMREIKKLKSEVESSIGSDSLAYSTHVELSLE